MEGEELFAEAVVELFLPFGGEEGDDGVGAGEEVRAVAPDAIRRIGFGNVGWVPEEGRGLVEGKRWEGQGRRAGYSRDLGLFSLLRGRSLR